MAPKTDAERARAYRRRKGIKPRKLEGHGTIGGWRRHERNKEPLCPACLDERRKYKAEQARERRSRQNATNTGTA